MSTRPTSDNPTSKPDESADVYAKEIPATVIPNDSVDEKTTLLPPNESKPSIWARPGISERTVSLTTLAPHSPPSTRVGVFQRTASLTTLNQAIKTSEMVSASGIASPEARLQHETHKSLVRVENSAEMQDMARWVVAGFRLFRMAETLRNFPSPPRLYPNALPLRSLVRFAHQLLLAQQVIAEQPTQHRRSLVTQTFGPLLNDGPQPMDRRESILPNHGIKLVLPDDIFALARRLLGDIAHWVSEFAQSAPVRDSNTRFSESPARLLNTLMMPRQSWFYPDLEATITNVATTWARVDTPSHAEQLPTPHPYTFPETALRVPHWLTIAASAAPLLVRANAVILLANASNPLAIGGLLGLWDYERNDDDRTLHLLVAALLPTFGHAALPALDRLTRTDEPWNLRWLATATRRGFKTSDPVSSAPLFTDTHSFVQWEQEPPIAVFPNPLVTSSGDPDWFTLNSSESGDPNTDKFVELSEIRRQFHRKCWKETAQRGSRLLIWRSQKDSMAESDHELVRMVQYSFFKLHNMRQFEQLIATVELFQPIDLCFRHSEITWIAAKTTGIQQVGWLLARLTGLGRLNACESTNLGRLAMGLHIRSLVAGALLLALNSHLTRWLSNQRDTSPRFRLPRRRQGKKVPEHLITRHYPPADRSNLTFRPKTRVTTTPKRHVWVPLPTPLRYLLRQNPPLTAADTTPMCVLYTHIGLMTWLHETTRRDLSDLGTPTSRHSLRPVTFGIQQPASPTAPWANPQWWFGNALSLATTSEHGISPNPMLWLHLAVCAFGIAQTSLGNRYRERADIDAWAQTPAVIHSFGEAPFLLPHETLTEDGCAMLILLISGHKVVARSMLSANAPTFAKDNKQRAIQQMQRIFGAYRIS